MLFCGCVIGCLPLQSLVLPFPGIAFDPVECCTDTTVTTRAQRYVFGKIWGRLDKRLQDKYNELKDSSQRGFQSTQSQCSSLRDGGGAKFEATSLLHMAFRHLQ